MPRGSTPHSGTGTALRQALQLSGARLDATFRAASEGAIPSPAITTSRYSSDLASSSDRRSFRSYSSSALRSRASRSASASSCRASLLESRSAIELTACSSCARLSRSLSSTLTHSGWSSGTTWFRSTSSALVVWLVTRTLFPCASRCPMRLPMVWVLPVPGGPWTSTQPCWSSRWQSGSARGSQACSGGRVPAPTRSPRERNLHCPCPRAPRPFPPRAAMRQAGPPAGRGPR